MPWRLLIPRILLFSFVTIRCVWAMDMEIPLGDRGPIANGNATTLTNRGIELLAKGDHTNARRFFDAAIRSDPGSYILYYNRAIYFRAMHQWQPALQDLNTCCRLKPTYLNAFLLRASTNTKLGKYRDSLADYNALVNLGSVGIVALDYRAWLFATCPDSSIRNGPAAVQDATAACRLTSWDMPTYIDTLAAAYAESGDFANAVKFEEKALAKARYLKWDTTDMEKHLALYQQHKPYREPRGTAVRGGGKPEKVATD